MRNLLITSAVLAVLAGVVAIAAGGWGIYFTYQNIARENIVTTSDASIPKAPVRGPLTLKAQADIIREHTLRAMEGRTYSEIPRGEDNSMWITAMTLITALNLGVLTYAFSGLVVFLGLISIWTGVTFYALSRRF